MKWRKGTTKLQVAPSTAPRDLQPVGAAPARACKDEHVKLTMPRHIHNAVCVTHIIMLRRCTADLGVYHNATLVCELMCSHPSG